MCGIAGFADFTLKSTSEQLESMTRVIAHRGPDDSGAEFFQAHTACIGLGFRRLAIIDLTPSGHQPMHNPSQDTWIIFNGEIYNFMEIRVQLEQNGYTFISGSDTEVILKSYEHWGLKCIDHFIGMFAIALYDPGKQKLILIRDRAGVKPLFYYWADNVFLFGSELKSFHQHPSFRKEIDPQALSLFFQNGCITAPYSIFKNTFKLVPGHYLELDLRSGEFRTSCYWDAADAYQKPKLEISMEEAMEKTESLFVSAFKYRMIADVPVGLFLSGGYDSSCVTALLQKNSSAKIKTYTIGFEDEKYNEAVHAKKVANFLETDHHEYICTFQEAKDIIPEIASIYDEPFGDSSAIPTTLVSRIARKHVTVALSADAGDELFAGYPRHKKILSYLRLFKNIPVSVSSLISTVLVSGNDSLVKADRLDKLKQVLATTDSVERFNIIKSTYTRSESRYLINPEIQKSESPSVQKLELGDNIDDLSKILLSEYKHYLVDDILQKVDRATMSASLEGREPFLDHRILELVARLPSEYKMKNGRQKILLKNIVHKHIPESIMARPKMGFGIPLKDWMLTDLKPIFMDHMSDDKLEMSGMLNLKAVREIRDAYLSGKLENFERVWFIFIFQQWFERWMK